MKKLSNLVSETLAVLSPRGRGSLAVFLGFFALYLFTMTPSLAPYRDTGEFTLSSVSLGVSHPPSYPLYVLLGHLASLNPLGSPAYAVAILSALAGAGALAVLFRLGAGLFGPWAALIGVLLLGTDSVFWSVCLVQEMYTLTLLKTRGKLFLLFRRGGILMHNTTEENCEIATLVTVLFGVAGLHPRSE